MPKEFIPKIGKNVIETLTTGMYEDPRFIYREYIQNAADQIDVAVNEGVLSNRAAGKIEIKIDDILGIITIEDNATGIRSSQIRRFLGDVANSDKEPGKQKGFRGIGRLGGLGYCDRLVFETSYAGEEIKNIMTLNADLLRKLIANRNDNSDAASVISVVTKLRTEKEVKSKHYFRVILEGVVIGQDILDIYKVRQYIEMVAPVEFNPAFSYTAKIKNYFKKYDFVFDEYKTFINDDQIYKGYKNYIIKKDQELPVTDIGFFQVRDPNHFLLGLGWYGIYVNVNEVIDKDNIERGIRIRMGNIAIGDEKTLFRRFKADRTNLRYIGEVHVRGEGFIPNARRDYFNDSKTLTDFQSSLEMVFDDFESKLPHRASNLHRRKEDIEIFREAINAFRKEQKAIQTNEHRQQRIEEILNLLEKAENASKRIDKIREEGKSNSQVGALVESIVGDYDTVIHDDELKDLYIQKVYPPLSFNRINKDQEKLLNEVVVDLLKSFGYRKANPFIEKLLKRYNK